MTTKDKRYSNGEIDDKQREWKEKVDKFVHELIKLSNKHGIEIQGSEVMSFELAPVDGPWVMYDRQGYPHSITTTAKWIDEKKVYITGGSD